jgi:hypothetical protein
MPSPFPGMDPYLEAPEIWPDLHHELISVIREHLNARLRPRYHSMVEERVYISDDHDPGRRVIVPDVAIQVAAGSAEYRKSDGSEGIELAVAEPVVATTMIEEEIREARIVIVDGVGRQVVTVIEVLSPTNKIVGSRGRTNYEVKRMEVMQSPAHLVEIDLLRDGEPIYAGERLPPHDYLVHVSRQGQRPKGILWPILIAQRLPTIKIPLLPGDEDAELNLGDVLNSAYDRAGYDLAVDYTKPPRVPLAPPKDRWAADWLAAGRS